MILHIPHSGTDTIGRNIEQKDIDELTDWFTDELFEHENSARYG
jgi:N-formylglutamate amidohydrolase